MSPLRGCVLPPELSSGAQNNQQTSGPPQHYQGPRDDANFCLVPANLFTRPCSCSLPPRCPRPHFSCQVLGASHDGSYFAMECEWKQSLSSTEMKFLRSGKERFVSDRAQAECLHDSSRCLELVANLLFLAQPFPALVFYRSFLRDQVESADASSATSSLEQHPPPRYQGLAA
eukprot:767455-Hanusia_phi.AAC.1